MKKLLQIDSCLNMLSTGRITESIGKRAIERGWRPYIVHGARYTRAGSCMTSICAESIFGEYAHYVEGLFLDNHGLSSRLSTEKVIDKIKEIKPDIVQLHCIHGYYLNYRILFEYLNSTRIPVVWTFHDCWSFTGHCSHFVMAGCEKWKTGCFKCPLKGEYPKSFVDHSRRNYELKNELFTANKNLHIVTVSKWLENLVRQSFFSDKDITTIYNGVDTEVFHKVESEELRKRWNLKNKNVLVAAATSWNKYKGLDDYIQISKKLPNNTSLLLIGLTKEQIKSMPAGIIGIEKTNSAEELAGYYSMADVVLNLSYAETFGLTTVEGMACGTPGIVYNTTASPELITPETGIVVEAGSINQVLTAVNILLEKGKDYYTSACLNRAKNVFDKEERFEDYMSLYERLLNE